MEEIIFKGVSQNIWSSLILNEGLQSNSSKLILPENTFNLLQYLPPIKFVCFINNLCHTCWLIDNKFSIY